MSAIPPRLRPLLDAGSATQELARLLTDAGHECYLVGGSVRDAFLDRALRDEESADVDLTTDARPDVVERLVRPWADAVWLQGQRFGTVGCRKDDTVLEITTFRAEVYRARESQAGGGVLRRHRDRSLAARLHRQRDGAAPARTGAGRSVRRRGRPRVTPPAYSARSGGVVPRRSVAHAPRRRASSRSSSWCPIPRSPPRWSSCATGSRS